MTQYCLECARNKEDCCSSDYAKFVTLKDTMRISEFLHKSVRNFVIYSGLSKGDLKTDLFKGKHHNYYYDLVSHDKKILQLKKKKDGSCIFLDKCGSCKIYSVRPLICRVYPFWYLGKGSLIVDNNGLSCSIIRSPENKDSHSLKKRAKLHPKLVKIGHNSLSMKRLISKLMKEINDYSLNYLKFIKKNKIK